MVETWDTVVVWGPHTFVTPTGSLVNLVEQIVFDVDPDTRYELRVEKGNASLDSVPSVGRVFFNGNWTTGVADMGSSQTVYRVVQPVDTGFVRVELSGDPGDFMRVTLLAQPSPSFTIFGPETYDRPDGPFVWHVDSATVPAAAKPPFRLHMVRGEPPGTQAADSAIIVVGDSVIIQGKANFFDGTSVVRSVSANRVRHPGDTIEVGVKVFGAVGGKFTVWVTATDSTPPLVSIDAPADSAFVSATAVTVTGTVADGTAVRVSANGLTASLGSNGAFSVEDVPLTEGGNTIVVTAVNGAGLRLIAAGLTTPDEIVRVVAPSLPLTRHQ